MTLVNAAYAEFLDSKAPSASMVGIEPNPINPQLFPFQRDCVDFLLRAGRGGLFLDTGLGKTLCQLEWCRQTGAASNGRSLILTPLAVAQQIAREGRHFGYDVRVIREQSDAADGINVCNYERLDKIDTDYFGAVSLDESSIIKSFTGKTTRALIGAFRDHRFRLSATATPAPNDHMELGNHAEFCGVMQSNEMLSRFFINDTSKASQEWRLKRHGVRAFWDWMASWSRMAQMPSDLGYSDDGFELPPLNVHTHHADQAPIIGNDLFGTGPTSATNMHDIKRQTSESRAAIAASLVMSNDNPWVVWVDTDYEADAVWSALRGTEGVVEVRGSMSADQKEAGIVGFSDGTHRVIITKSSICGFGLNWQHCADTVFVGRTFSYESWYQAVRRLWRFGQDRPVDVHIVIAQGEESIARVIDRKSSDHLAMKAAMRDSMKRNMGKASATRVAYSPTHEGHLPVWLTR